MSRLSPAWAASLAFLLGTLASGLGIGAAANPPAPAMVHSSGGVRFVRPLRPDSSLIQHVVVIVQENRTIDNLFQSYNTVYPGAGLDVQSYGLNSQNQQVQLQPVTFEAPYDLSHAHYIKLGAKPGGFVTEFNNGAMNGFDKEQITCKVPSGCPGATAYGYVPASETGPYFQLAHSFAIADHVLQSNEGPSFPAHQYLIAGQSGGFSNRYAERENPSPNTGGCNVAGATIPTIDMQSTYPGLPGTSIFPCETYAAPSTVLEALDAKFPSDPNWQYYVPSKTSIWAAPMGVSTIYNNPAEAAKVITPESNILNAIKNGTLHRVSYVIPCGKNSDHANSRSATGPLWVASVVNAIGQSKYWNHTAIVITWDDWGGWYDHWTPYHPGYNPTDPYEYGFRVPFIVVSPYAKAGYVDHTHRDFTSAVRFIETVFGLPSLNTLDQYTDDLTTTMFNFSQQPLPYTPINTGSFNPFNCAASRTLENQPVDD